MKLFSIYDSKAGIYLRPFMELSLGLAIRKFEGDVCNPQSPACKHAPDYTLFQIGEYDQSSGIITPCVPTVIENGLTTQTRALPEMERTIEVMEKLFSLQQRGDGRPLNILREEIQPLPAQPEVESINKGVQ